MAEKKGDYFAKEDLKMVNGNKVVPASTPGAGVKFALRGQRIAAEIAEKFNLYDLDKPAEAAGAGAAGAAGAGAGAGANKKDSK